MPSSPEAEEAKPTSTTPCQVRTRITVVCAECKRLKLKCDRGVPCSSCKKRGTVSRCQYSEKAFQKLDLHSLNTRLSRVEAALTQLTPSVSATLDSRPLMLSLSELSTTWLDPSSFPVAATPPSHPSPPPPPTHLLPSLAIYFDRPPTRPHVTQNLLTLLPNSRIIFARYFTEAERTLRIRPCFNWPRFRSRAEALIHSQDTSSTATISLFAATCSALAIGALASQDPPDEAALFLDALSHQALSVVEMHPLDQQPEADMDYIVASILQVVYIFRSGQIHPGKSSTAKKVMGSVGKMINLARQMSLNIDPSELDLALDEPEMENRRRLWWQIVWFDTYVSNIMGHLPLTADNTFTTKTPHDGTGYFGLSCRLAYLVRKMATLVDNVKTASQLTTDSLGRAYTLDQASTLELQVKQLLDDIPLVLEGSSAETSNLDGPDRLSEASVASQQCELSVMAQKLLIRIYLPFLAPPPPNLTTSPTTWSPPHQASFATVNAAHAIVDACRRMYAIWQNDPFPRHYLPALFDLYPMARTLFDAAIVCAHATINQPNTMWATVALEDVRIALGLLTDKAASLERWPDIEHSDAIQLLELLKDKAESAVGGGSPNALKRKSSVVDEPGTPGSASGPRKSPTTERTNGDGVIVDERPKNSRRPVNNYPAVGIRVRPNTKLSGGSTASSSPKATRSRRTGSTSTTETARSQSRMKLPPALNGLSSPNGTGAMVGSNPSFRSRASSINQSSPILVPHHGTHQQPPIGIHPLDVHPALPLADGNIIIDPSAPVRGKGYQPWLNICWDAYRQGLSQPEYVGSQFEQPPGMYINEEAYEHYPNVRCEGIPLGTFPFPQPGISGAPHGKSPNTFSFPPSNDSMPSSAVRTEAIIHEVPFAGSHPYYHYPTQPSFEGLSPPGQQQQQQIHNISASLVGLGLQGLGSSSTMDPVLSSSASAAPSIYDEELTTPSDSVAASSSSSGPNVMQVGNGSGQQTSSHHGWVPSDEFDEAQNRNVAINGGHFWPNANPEFQYYRQ